MTIHTLSVTSTSAVEIVNVTAQISALIHDVADGIVLCYTPHTTASLILCEDDDDLRSDILRAATQMFAPLRPFTHIRNNNPNAEAHFFSAIAGTQIMLAIHNGKLDLGTYQNALFIELDGPKTREIRCKVLRGVT
jgi:secondary thiamine-phosphate synthase enzyme